MSFLSGYFGLTNCLTAKMICVILHSNIICDFIHKVSGSFSKFEKQGDKKVACGMTFIRKKD